MRKEREVPYKNSEVHAVRCPFWGILVLRAFPDKLLLWRQEDAVDHMDDPIGG
ncbi:hypothetical protein BH10CHL1_BH10CHL1_14700 [soil metagenome]